MFTASIILLALQSFALVVLVRRLLPGRHRRPPVCGAGTAEQGSVSVIVATRNEARRIRPCLSALSRQGPSMLEAIVVDSNSTDGTQAMVTDVAQRDARIRLLPDRSLPEGWIGKVWALQTGLAEARGEWVLGIDADTEPAPALTDAVVRAAIESGLDAVSFAPRFAGQSAGERWLQPAMLVTLVYRTGAPGAPGTDPERVLANGQCFLVRRELLLRSGGYASARHSFSDDVTLARHLAASGARVGFLDGSRVILVRSYTSIRQVWTEWGRSFDLKDSSPLSARYADVALVWLTQALPLPLLATAALSAQPLAAMFAVVNIIALGIRVSMLVVLRGSYTERGLPYWLSFTADIPAAIRLTISSVRRAREWRGRFYGASVKGLESV